MEELSTPGVSNPYNELHNPSENIKLVCNLKIKIRYFYFGFYNKYIHQVSKKHLLQDVKILICS